MVRIFRPASVRPGRWPAGQHVARRTRRSRLPRSSRSPRRLAINRRIRSSSSGLAKRRSGHRRRGPLHLELGPPPSAHRPGACPCESSATLHHAASPPRTVGRRQVSSRSNLGQRQPCRCRVDSGTRSSRCRAAPPCLRVMCGKLVRRRHHHHVGQGGEVGHVRSCRASPRHADEASAVDREADRQVLDRHVMHHLVVGALQERRIDRAERPHPCAASPPRTSPRAVRRCPRRSCVRETPGTCRGRCPMASPR